MARSGYSWIITRLDAQGLSRSGCGRCQDTRWGPDSRRGASKRVKSESQSRFFSLPESMLGSAVVFRWPRFNDFFEDAVVGLSLAVLLGILCNPELGPQCWHAKLVMAPRSQPPERASIATSMRHVPDRRCSREAVFRHASRFFVFRARILFEVSLLVEL